MILVDKQIGRAWLINEDNRIELNGINTITFTQQEEVRFDFDFGTIETTRFTLINSKSDFGYGGRFA